MNAAIEHRSNTATAAQIAAHLTRCEADFVPPLSGRVRIEDYARKIAAKAARFEAWAGGALVGLVSMYCDPGRGSPAFITNVSVLREWTGRGIASVLLRQSIAHARSQGAGRIGLEVASANTDAIRCYESCGFVVSGSDAPFVKMNLNLAGQATNMNKNRDYDAEIRDTNDHQYAYAFDFDVMHPFMIRSFAPFFAQGSVLELGSYKGDFTRRLLPHFDDVTCVEASDIAIVEAKRKLGAKVTFVNSLFETARLPKRYDNIVLTHVLEHLDDPVGVLRRVNGEWLAEGGRLFLVCPNANAPSRQIAVKMGLISHNAAVTPAEAEHGHRCTYSLDTLEQVAVASGLRVVHRSGIFFKALANFQWDRLLQTDIISKEYLEGCFKLGQDYPDLCSSIFLMCERGEPR